MRIITVPWLVIAMAGRQDVYLILGTGLATDTPFDVPTINTWIRTRATPLSLSCYRILIIVILSLTS